MRVPVSTSTADWVAAYPPPRSLPLDQEALRIFERAYYIGVESEPNDEPKVTFTTLMAALLVGTDTTSEWFARLAQTLGPSQEVLVIGTGAPSISTEILQRLSDWDPTETYDDVVQAFRRRDGSEWTMAVQIIETLMRSRRGRRVAELRGWARRVGRYLMHRPFAELSQGLSSRQPAGMVPPATETERLGPSGAAIVEQH